MGYKEDLATALKKQSDLIASQVLLEIIRIVTECESYDEFRKTMYGIALGYMKELEDEGYGSNSTKVSENGSNSDDSGILI